MIPIPPLAGPRALDKPGLSAAFQNEPAQAGRKVGMPLDAPTQRPEFIPEQLRVNLDAALFFAEAIAGQEDQIAALRQHAVEAEAYVKQLNGQIKELESDRNDLNRTGKTSGLPND